MPDRVGGREQTGAQTAEPVGRDEVREQRGDGRVGGGVHHHRRGEQREQASDAGRRHAENCRSSAARRSTTAAPAAGVRVRGPALVCMRRTRHPGPRGKVAGAMTEVLRVLAAIVLAAHGLVHLLYLLPADDDPGYPFALHRLSVLPARWRRPAGAVLASIVVVAALALGLAVAGVPGLGAEWPALALATADPLAASRRSGAGPTADRRRDPRRGAARPGRPASRRRGALRARLTSRTGRRVKPVFRVSPGPPRESDTAG